MPNSTPNPAPRVNHLFVDFENVQEVDPVVFGKNNVSLTLLLGSRQTKLGADLVERLLEHAASVQLVRLTSDGRNALDFALAYYVGRAAAADPTGFFHIVSKDKGFDPLIDHLRSRRIRASRHDAFNFVPLSGPVAPSIKAQTAIPAVLPSSSASAAKPKPPASTDHAGELHLYILEVLDHLSRHSTNLPRTKTKLVRYVDTHLGNLVNEAQAATIVDTIGQEGYLFVHDDDRVTYHLRSNSDPKS